MALTAWVFEQLHARAPLIELRLLRHPMVLTGDVCAIVLRVVMYMNLSGIVGELVSTIFHTSPA